MYPRQEARRPEPPAYPSAARRAISRGGMPERFVFTPQLL
jgi:hypothetical protein